MLVVAEPFLVRNMHPTVIVRAYARALEVALETAERLSTRVELSDVAQMRSLIRSCIATKFSARYGDLISDLALAAVRTVTVEEGAGGAKEIDTKRYARVEKIPGGELDECTVLRGVMMEKDVTHPKMRRRIEKPRIMLLDCPLEYKKAESATNLELAKEEDFEAILKQEEEFIAKACAEIIAFKPDLVIVRAACCRRRRLRARERASSLTAATPLAPRTPSSSPSSPPLYRALAAPSTLRRRRRAFRTSPRTTCSRRASQPSGASRRWTTCASAAPAARRS